MNKDRLVNDEKGAITIIFELSFISIMIICSLALDYGMVYFNAAKAQNALDASILAAGQELPVDEDDEIGKERIRDIVIDYLNKNGLVDLSTLHINFTNSKDGKYIGMEVDCEVNTQLNFARIIDVDSISVTKTAMVKILPNTKVADVVPLAVKKMNLDVAIASGDLTHITLKYSGSGGTGGDFGAIDLDGVKSGGASDYERWLTYGYTKEMGIGEGLLPVESGNMSGPTASALNARYNSCTHFPSQGGCNKDHFDPACPRVLKTPVVVNIDSKTVKIVAFAAFVLDSPSESTSGYITGSFITLVLPGIPAQTQTDISGADYGIYSLKLSN